ncbi:glycoside hydrolase family 10 protein [Sediminibacterium soli]|uniref:glycoside hydrolase family 10 protein n=1 Tax=Sediminibacterium soli TaxID=2698829 RepID=UPI00137A6F69|nr:family 10 glycosylhydrolase [Sediminibacterium soli]NCI46847.1 family 10 glycosylhydrolase [Sediminibacterium soli]
MRYALAIFALATVFSACGPAKKTTVQSLAANPPAPQANREFRAAWVATVANINWPSKPGLSAEQQQQEAISLLDFLQANHFNAVIFQVRPQADALYKSELEPWSYFLTGAQGKAPEPFYDPLAFWVEAAHKRGLELHVWLNPYRAHHRDGSEISGQSIVKQHPELVMKLKEGYWWMDPSRQEVQDHTSKVVRDIVKRYDIDGVHFDDYFYPYPSYNAPDDFPDEASWNAYKSKGGELSRGDWRRQSVNTLIERLYGEIKTEKKYVKFGLSPFGIWRPGYPASIQGFDQYEQLYADAKLWLNKGWIDYFAPQLYWPINRITQSFPVLLGWWQSENTLQRHLWPGISLGRDTSARNVNEILSQVMISRGMLPQSPGVIHWSLSSLTGNPNMVKGLVDGPYKQEALVPSSPWLGNDAPAAPTVSLSGENGTVTVSWTHPDEKNVFRWVVYAQYGNTWTNHIPAKEVHSWQFNSTEKNRLTKIIVTAVDRLGNESEKKTIVL